MRPGMIAGQTKRVSQAEVEETRVKNGSTGRAGVQRDGMLGGRAGGRHVGLDQFLVSGHVPAVGQDVAGGQVVAHDALNGQDLPLAVVVGLAGQLAGAVAVDAVRVDDADLPVDVLVVHAGDVGLVGGDVAHPAIGLAVVVHVADLEPQGTGLGGGGPGHDEHRPLDPRLLGVVRLALGLLKGRVPIEVEGLGGVDGLALEGGQVALAPGDQVAVVQWRLDLTGLT